MGYNDHMDGSELANLPAEAHGETVDQPFDPDDHWLRRAEPDDQLIAMKEWFLAHYCDPAKRTPYNSREGGYQFIHGGPHDPAEELPDRFSGIVHDNLIEQIVNEMHAEVGDEWAPLHEDPPDDYDERYALDIVAVSEPLRRLRERLQQAQAVLTLVGNPEAKALAEKLVFGATIGALEAFLYETANYWIDTDEVALRDCVTKLPEFRDQQIKLGDLYVRHAGLKDYVKGYLQNLVWHRWEKVGPLFKHARDVRLPTLKVFDAALLKRHDIVHRSGHDKDGAPTEITTEEIRELCSKIEAFAVEVDDLLEKRKIRLSLPAPPPSTSP